MMPPLKRTILKLIVLPTLFSIASCNNSSNSILEDVGVDTIENSESAYDDLEPSAIDSTPDQISNGVNSSTPENAYEELSSPVVPATDSTHDEDSTLALVPEASTNASVTITPLANTSDSADESISTLDETLNTSVELSSTLDQAPEAVIEADASVNETPTEAELISSTQIETLDVGIESDSNSNDIPNESPTEAEEINSTPIEAVDSGNEIHSVSDYTPNETSEENSTVDQIAELSNQPTSEQNTLTVSEDTLTVSEDTLTVSEDTLTVSEDTLTISDNDDPSILSSGNGNTTNTASNNEETDNASELSGAVAPFEKVSFQIKNSIEFVNILYRDNVTAQEVVQPSFKNSLGEFTIMAIPLSMEGINTYQVSNDGKYLGIVDIQTNSMIAQNNSPGQYSLTVLTSILSGLKEELATFTEAALTATAGSDEGQPENNLLENIGPIQKTISSFQELVLILENAVINETPILNPLTNDVIVERKDLETLDGLFHHIVSRYTTDASFSAYAFQLIQESLKSGGSGFNLIFAAATHQLKDWDGIAALASLEMYSTDYAQHSNLESLNHVLDIIKAGLFPAIIAIELQDIRSGTGRSNIEESVRLFKKVEVESQQPANFIFSDGLNALESVVEAITNTR